MTEATPRFARVDLDSEELSILLSSVEAQAAEQERILDRLAESEGDQATFRGVQRTVERRVETLRLLALKLEAGARDAGWRR